MKIQNDFKIPKLFAYYEIVFLPLFNDSTKFRCGCFSHKYYSYKLMRANKYKNQIERVRMMNAFFGYINILKTWTSTSVEFELAVVS